MLEEKIHEILKIRPIYLIYEELTQNVGMNNPVFKLLDKVYR